jgi:hypothetical protein
MQRNQNQYYWKYRGIDCAQQTIRISNLFILVG